MLLIIGGVALVRMAFGFLVVRAMVMWMMKVRVLKDPLFLNPAYDYGYSEQLIERKMCVYACCLTRLL
jgi:hypothetical protein